MALGGKRENAGRKKGTRNRSTEQAKQLLSEFVGNNMGDLQSMFEKVKEEDPKKAVDVLIGTLEYIVPKLSRVDGEHKGNITLTIESAIKGIPNSGSSKDSSSV